MSLDTLKMTFPADCVQDFDWLRAMKQTVPYDMPDGSQIMREIYKSNRRDKGGAYFEYRPDEKTCLLEFSAKVLGKDYMLGISDVTLEYAAAMIHGQNCGLRLNLDRLAEKATVLRADPVVNLKLPGPMREYIEAVKLGKNWKRKRRNDIFDSSALWFTSTEEMSIYDKAEEVRTDPTLYKMIHADVDGVLRLEYRAKKRYSLRKRWGIPSRKFAFQGKVRRDQKDPVSELSEPKLRDVLDREKNLGIVRSVWSEMETMEVGLFDAGVKETMDKHGLTTSVKLFGYLRIWDACSHSDAILKDWIFETSPRRSAHRYYREARQLITAGLSYKKKANDRISEISLALEKVKPL